MIANCRCRPLSAIHDLKSLYNFLRKTILFLMIVNCRKRCNSEPQGKVYNFSRETILFLMIANCRNRPISAIHDLKRKTIPFLMIANWRNRPLSGIHGLKKIYTISQEKLYYLSSWKIAEIDHFLQFRISRKAI